MRLFRTLLVFALFFSAFSAQGQGYSLIPNPEYVESQQGIFTLDKLQIKGQSRGFSPFQEWLKTSKGIQIHTGKTPAGPEFKEVRYTLDASKSAEGYELRISPKVLEIVASTDAGFLYAEQTLIQLAEQNSNRFLPCMLVRDHPRFAWRGMHLDESRHFMGKAFVKKYIDWLFMLKMNTFHWHLTDATGWRIEIKKYPKLTSIGAWRPARPGILNSDADTARLGEPMTYGGFYTQDDVREIVQYAAQRNITIIPEIEMPGHTTAALVAYPEYSCTGGPFPMPGGAKNCPYPNFCVGNEQTYVFLEQVLTEVMALFPSPYIHIGGDEVERNQWASCKKCQAQKTALGLENEAQLQVYFTKRIENFLIKKGRRLMGWDEIMEGDDLTASAGVMVWRGEGLANEATAAGHEVVIAHNYYFDLYQGNPEFEPVTYGYLPLEQVYTYEPVPANFSPEQQQKVLGVEGCLWTENVYNSDQAAYMLFPRLLALAEVAWTKAERRSWSQFQQHIPGMLEWLDKNNARYATSVFDPSIVVTADPYFKTLQCSFEQQVPYGAIHYTIDGSEPSPDALIYTHPFSLAKACTVKASTIFPNGKQSKTLSIKFNPSLASNRPFTLANLPDKKYNGDTPSALTDGLNGGAAFHDGHWCGFYGYDFDMTIDLDSLREVHSVSLNWLETEGSWVYLPEEMWVEVSDDKSSWKKVGAISKGEITAASTNRIKPVSIALQGQKARYVRVFAKNKGQHPVYPEGKCWLFIDELRVD